MAAARATGERLCDATAAVFSGDGHGSRRRGAAALFLMKLFRMFLRGGGGVNATKRQSFFRRRTAATSLAGDSSFFPRPGGERQGSGCESARTSTFSFFLKTKRCTWEWVPMTSQPLISDRRCARI
jgi:hypothetical protein